MNQISSTITGDDLDLLIGDLVTARFLNLAGDLSQTSAKVSSLFSGIVETLSVKLQISETSETSSAIVNGSGSGSLFFFFGVLDIVEILFLDLNQG